MARVRPPFPVSRFRFPVAAPDVPDVREGSAAGFVNGEPGTVNGESAVGSA